MRSALLFVLLALQAGVGARAQLDPPEPRELIVYAPDSLAGFYDAGGVYFGPRLEPGGGVIGELVPVGQEADSTDQACGPVPNPGEIEGKIALIRRGNCPFIEKVRHAQAAGAVAVLIFNNALPCSPADSTLFMGSSGDPGGDITIPSGFVTGCLGRQLRDASPGVLARLQFPEHCYGPTEGEPDPVAPERYYPLAVGNAWEYETIDQPPGVCAERSRLDVTRDTTAGGTSYFVLREAEYTCDDPQAMGFTEHLVRFDAEAAWAVERVADGSERVWRDTACPLDADFGVMLQTCASPGWPWVVSSYNVRQSEPDAKVFGGCFVGYKGPNVGVTFQADRGLTASGGGMFIAHVRLLRYARVNGVEWGSPALWPVSVEEGPPAPAQPAAYPNPFHDRATLTVRLETPQAITLDAFDALGRCVRHEALGHRPAGPLEAAFDGAGLPAGAYVVRLTGDAGLAVAFRLVRTP